MIPNVAALFQLYLGCRVKQRKTEGVGVVMMLLFGPQEVIE